MRSLLCLLAALTSGVAVADDAEHAAAQTLLEGGWRYDAMGAEPPACDQPPSATGQTITFEFTMTGGRVAFPTADGEDMQFGVSLSASGSQIALKGPDGPDMIFDVTGPDTMAGGAMTSFAGVLQGKTFRKCYPAADRSKIHLTHEKPPLPMGDFAYLSQGGLAEQPRFVDTRFNNSPYEVCGEPEAQYVFFDVSGPLAFTMGRWNTVALGEKLADGGKAKVNPDDVANWAIEAVEPIENGWKITATELIPPNGSRGDTTTFSVLTKENAMWIPEWGRNYWRCTTGLETVEEAE